MDSDLIRAYWLRDREQIKNLMPTKQQLKIVKDIKAKGMTNSIDIATTFDITLQQATMVLKACYDKGYIKRRDIGSLTGGQFFVYWCALPILKEKT